MMPFQRNWVVDSPTKFAIQRVSVTFCQALPPDVNAKVNAQLRIELYFANVWSESGRSMELHMICLAGEYPHMNKHCFLGFCVTQVCLNQHTCIILI